MEKRNDVKAEMAKLIEEKAYEYAKSVVVDPDNHKDAVDAIAFDFINGAYFILTQNLKK